MKQADKITSELLKRCVQDDRNAIRSLYEICFVMLMPVCLRYHAHQEDARSSLHLAFMKMLKSLNIAPIGVEFFAWSKRIVINTLIDEYRKKRIHQQRELSKENEYEIEIHGDQSVNEGTQSVEYELIIRMVNELPALTSKVFNLYVIEGYAHKEIADLLDMSEGTSKWHLSNARKMLKARLESLEQYEINKLKTITEV